MRFRRALAFALPAGLVLLANACGSDESTEEAATAAQDSAGAPGVALDDPDDAVVAPVVSPDSLSLNVDGELVLGPGDVVELTIEASPPGIYEIRLSLLDEVQDASLAKGKVETDEAGRATVQLTAPTTPSTFRVRITSGDASLETAVSVKADPVAVLTVVPLYAGERDTPHWIAEAFPGVSCAELSAAEVAAPHATAADDGEVLRLENLPVDTPMAVVARYEQAVSGCVDVAALRAQELRVVEVRASDRPTQVETTAFSVRFSVDDTYNAWYDGLSESIAPTLASALGEGESFRHLLDTMAESLDPEAASSFTATRNLRAWDARIWALWGNSASTRIADVLRGWMQQGVDDSASTDVFVGTLDFETTPEAPIMPMTSLAGVEATQAALATPVDVALELGPSNSVALGGRFYWQPSRLLAGLALTPALAATPEATSATEALAAQLDCGGVARSLVEASDDASIYEGCDEACAAEVCLAACDLIWIAVRGASAQRSSEATLDWSARAAAQVDEGSQLTSFDGAWVGTLTVEDTTLSLRGGVEGSL